MEDDATIVGTIDVVIPMRNGRATIQQTLDSVTAQTLLPRRIIVVDDGSTDGGAELLRGHPLIDVIATPPRGVSHARNIGIGASRAEFIAFLDCDDLWRADKLERQLAVARRVPQAAVITCDQISVSPRHEIIAETLHRPRFQGQALIAILLHGFALGGWSSAMMVRRKSLLESGGYDEALRYFEDVDICCRLARDHALAFCPELLTFIVENPNSTMRRSSAPAFALEVCIQGLVAMEKWIGVVEVSDAIASNCARLILGKLVHYGVGPSHLATLRRQLAARAPRLSARIARNDLHLLWSLFLAGLFGFDKALNSLRRSYARAGIGRRRAGVIAEFAPRPAPQAQTSA